MRMRRKCASLGMEWGWVSFHLPTVCHTHFWRSLQGTLRRRRWTSGYHYYRGCGDDGASDGGDDEATVRSPGSQLVSTSDAALNGRNTRRRGATQLATEEPWKWLQPRFPLCCKRIRHMWEALNQKQYFFVKKRTKECTTLFLMSWQVPGTTMKGNMPKI